MLYSKLLGKTKYDAPCDADSVNAKFLTQAGFVSKLSAGVYNFLPLGLRVMKKITEIIREEMNSVGSQELLMPSLHPIALWKTSGRNITMDDILYRTTAQGNKEFVFGPSHEEAVTPLVQGFVNSYKDLPLSVYQIQTKFRDEPRAKSGLLRGREFTMKDMYSFHTSDEDLDNYYDEVIEAYLRVFGRVGLHAYLIKASGGVFSDKFSHEFSVETEAGEDTILVCEKCGKAQNLEIAEGKIADVDVTEEAELPYKEVKLNHGASVEDHAKAHKVPVSKILKTVVYELENGGLIGVLIRGDLNVNQLKLEKYLGEHVHSASVDTLKSIGLVPGYISPVGLDESRGLSFVADHSIANIKNFVTGANKDGIDAVNVNIGRDFVVPDFADFVEVRGGFSCPSCGSSLNELKAVESGNIFKLGTKFSEAFKLKFTDSDGKQKPVIMGCYGIGVSRLLGTVVERFHDNNGIIWPKSITPYHVHLISIGKDDKVLDKVKALYDDFRTQGVEVLYDDRNVGAGVKFKDADLIGIPLRIVVSSRTIEAGGVEWKIRGEDDAKSVDFDNLMSEVKAFLSN